MDNNSFPGGAARPPSPPGGDGEGSPPLRLTDPRTIDFFNILRMLEGKSENGRLTVADVAAAHDMAMRVWGE